MNFKILVLDHDDTVVNSTATIHYPSFIAYLEDYHPNLVGNYTLESFMEKNFHPGVLALFKDEIGMSEEEMAKEEKYWADFVEKVVPTAYDGMREIIADFKAQGGIVAVVSHSLTRYIERDYRENGLPTPDVIYGWDIPKENRKPSQWCINDLAGKFGVNPEEILVVDDLKPGPWCINDLAKRYGADPQEILVVDDLKPGYDMARSAGARFAAVGWAHHVKTINDFMRKNCDFYLESTDELRKLLFN